MKNSSRLDAKIPRKRMRSRMGFEGSCASSNTRALKPSQVIARFKYRDWVAVTSAMAPPFPFRTYLLNTQAFIAAPITNLPPARQGNQPRFEHESGLQVLPLYH